ncbi:MAG TPA: M48 family metallopeptidase [Steroidobacteraceae bacterium]|jgi:Zn-dependent protease with chaperone function|nr:M48 family metallopeptidase [Steroidobacteraceae bacterium]
MLTADYFDGRSTRVRVVRLEVGGESLLISGEDIDRRVPFSEVKVDERLGRAPRRLRFADGAFCVVSDLNALDALLASIAHHDGWVDRIQRRARFVLLCLAACGVLAVAAYKWGLPWAAEIGAAHTPAGIGVKLSDQALEVLDGKILLSSRIGEDRRRQLNAKFHALRLPGGGTEQAELLFRRSPQLGANAFTLPDGRIIVLDDLITIVGDDRQILATLAHEAGHGHGNHGMRMLLQNSLVGAFLAFYVGDISNLLAIAPATLMQARYSRDFEAQADDYAAAVLRLNGMSPGLLADALDKLAKSHREGAGAAYLSSHPATDARMHHLRSQ